MDGASMAHNWRRRAILARRKGARHIDPQRQAVAERIAQAYELLAENAEQIALYDQERRNQMLPRQQRPLP